MSGAAVSIADSKELPDVGRGIWWAIATVTTVGYGDVVPHTVGGRIVASCLMPFGIGLISILTATIASSFIARDSDANEGATLDHVMQSLKRIEERLNALEP